MCGWSAVLTLLEMTRSRQDLAYELLHYRNSGDTPRYGDKRQVVGYAAMQLVRRTQDRIDERSATPKRSGTGDGKIGQKPGDGFSLGSPERTRLLAIARATVEACARGEREPEVDPASLPASLKIPSGAFVTLKVRGELRGCIGRFDASEPLFRTVRSMAVAAATQDPRFPPVASGELRDITVEISVLTPMRRITSAGEFTPGKHGITIRKGNRSGTFLPQVAQETGWSREELLGHCSRDKAGLGWEGWKDAELYVYEALVFAETDH
jgi:hypothetical protein